LRRPPGPPDTVSPSWRTCPVPKSMTANRRPASAEANAMLDGTDAVMLSGEWARRDHPVDSAAIRREASLDSAFPSESSPPARRKPRAGNCSFLRGVTRFSWLSTPKGGIPMLRSGSSSKESRENCGGDRRALQQRSRRQQPAADCGPEPADLKDMRAVQDTPAKEVYDHKIK
jgi:hypothetical protein